MHWISFGAGFVACLAFEMICVGLIVAMPSRKERSIMRLACRNCNTDEADEVYGPPPGWTDVKEDDCPSVWWTHLGYCPACSDFSEREFGVKET